MGKSWALLVGLVLTFGTASLGHAAVVEWQGTLTLQPFGMFGAGGNVPPFVHYGTGVATVNASAGAIGHINTILLHNGLSYSGGNNVPEVIPLTDPRTPTLNSVRATGLRLGRAGGMSNALTLNGISDGPPLGTKNTGQPPGRMKHCVGPPGCGNFLWIALGTKGGNGVGVGGMFTVNTYSKGNGFKLSLQGAPWTIGLASIKNVTTETANGGFATYTKTLQGFVHGPASGTSNTAAISGLIQIVTPVFIETSLGAPDTWQAMWTEVRLHFIPEPELSLLLGSGVGGLLLLGRFRMRG